MVTRQALNSLLDLARWYPVVVVTGPRQAGKTTLVRAAFPALPYVSLEDPDVRETASTDPRFFLAQFPLGAVLDEAQHAPALFAYLQGLVDEDRAQAGAVQPARCWVLTGSQHFGLLSSVTQSLAGRAGLLHLLPLSLGELQTAGHALARASLQNFLWSGLYPGPVSTGMPPAVWFADYVATYVERDVRQLVNVRDLASFRTVLRLCAARCSQALNLSALAVDAGVAVNTVKGWISVLEASYILFTLPQHHINLGKRLVKAPKLYFYDTGLAAWLAGLRSGAELAQSSLRGPLFESWAVAEAVKARAHLRREPSLHYWRDQSGTEVDLLLDAGSHLSPVEFKAGQTVASDWSVNLLRYAGLANKRSADGVGSVPITAPLLVYGGDAAHRRAGIECIAWRAWPDRVAALLAPTPPQGMGHAE